MESNEVHRAVGNFSWLFADKLLRFTLTLLVNALMARQLGPLGLGQLNYALAFCSILGFLVTQGLDQLVVRNLVREPEKAGETLGAVLVMRLIGSFFCIGFGFIVALSFGAQVSQTGPLIAVISFSYLANSCDFSDLWFQSRTMSKWTVLSRQMGLITAAIIRLSLVWNQAPLIAFAAAQVIETWATAMVQYYSFRYKSGPRLVFSGAFVRVKKLLKEGWPLSLCAITILLYSKFDQVLLARWRPIEEVGYYSSSLRILDYVNIFPMIISTSIFPFMIKAYGGQSSVWSERFEKILSFVNWGAWLGALALYLLATTVVLVLYGPKFENTVPLLQIVCWTVPAVFFSVVRHAWLTMKGRLGTALKFELSVACFSLVANFILIPRFGARGSAWSMLLTTYAANLVGLLWLRDLREPATLYLRSLIYPARLLVSKLAG